MVDVDPASGLPRETVEKKADLEKVSRLEGQKARSDQLVSDLTTEQGQAMINKIKERLMTRVNKIIEEDGECRALKNLLVDIGVTINVGDMATEKLARLLVRRQAP